MKKAIAGIVLALMIAIVPVTLVGCSGVTGTYKYYKTEFTYSDDVSEEMKANFESNTEEEDGSKGTSIIIKKNGVVVFRDSDGKEEEGKWEKVEGNTYKIYAKDSDVGQEVTIKNGKLTVSVTFLGITATTIYKK